MTQAADLGGIANQVATFYRARVNVGFQALASQHYGASEPPLLYPNMVWFDAGSGTIKLRDPTNSSWAVIGTIGPPMKFTCVDIPPQGFTTGDVKQTFKPYADAGWVMMNDGTIGDGGSGAWTRANPDTQALFTLLWNSILDAYCPLLAAGTATPTGRGASAAADWAAHRHIALPRALGRAFAHAGAGYGLTPFNLGFFWGQENVGLGLNNLPPHGHPYSWNVPPHDHGVGGNVGGGGSGPNLEAGSPNRGPTNWGKPTDPGGGYSGSGVTGSAGGGEPHFNIPPTTYCNVMIKL